MAAGEIMITAGVVAVIAAAVGGRVKGGGWEIPGLKSTRRQWMLAAIGLVFIASGIAVVNGFDPFRRPPQMAASVEPGVVFRSSKREDRFQRQGDSGYLILTSQIQVRNRPHSTGPITWSGTEATLEIGGRRIPYRAFSILTGKQTWDHWLGDETESLSGFTLKPGETADKTIIFMPVRTAGPDAFLWTDFVRHVLDDGDDPTFLIQAKVDRGGEGSERLEARCVLETGQYKEFVTGQVAGTAEPRLPGLSVTCKDGGGG